MHIPSKLMMRRLLAAGSVWALTLWSQSSVAQSDAVELDWTAPKACASADAAQRRLDELVSDAPVVAGLAARVSVSEAPDGWVAVVDLQRGERRGHREISGSSCKDVSEAALVVLALAAGSDSVGEEVPVEKPPVAPAKPSQPCPAVREKKCPAPRPAPRTDPDNVRAYVGFALLGERGLSPQPAPGAAIALGSGWRALSLETRFNYLLLNQLALDGNERVALRIWFASARFCVDLPEELSLATCLTGDVGQYSATGEDLVQSRTARGLWLDGQLSQRVGFAGRFAPYLEAGLRVPIRRPSVVVEGRGSVFSPEPVVVSLALGFELDFIRATEGTTPQDGFTSSGP